MKYKTLQLLMPFLFFCVALSLPGKSMAQVGGPGGLHTTPLYASQAIDAGLVSVWNDNQNINIKIETSDGWMITDVHIYAGYPLETPLPMTKKGAAIPGKFPYKMEYEEPVSLHMLALNLKEYLDFSWGSTSMGRRHPTFAVHADLVQLNDYGEVVAAEGAWAYGPHAFEKSWGWYSSYMLAHPMRGQFIDSPVQGLSYSGPTQKGVTGQGTSDNVEQGGFLFFPGEHIDFAVGSVPLGAAQGGKKVSPLDLFPGADTDDPRVINVARILQSLDADQTDGKIVLLPEVVSCFEALVGGAALDLGNDEQIEELISTTVSTCNGLGGAELAAVSAEEAQGNLEAGLNASGIVRKNVTKTEDWGETKQKLEVTPVYFPGKRSDGTDSFCDMDGNGIYDEGIDELGVAYEEWRLNGDPDAEECDPRDYEDETSCVVTLIECREVAKPIAVTYMEKIDIFEQNVTTDFSSDRFAHDIFTAVSRDDGTTWKRMNVSRMADLSSFDLKTGEPFPGTCRSPQMKVNDNQILLVWTSTFCRSGNPRYAINLCDDPETDIVENPVDGCAIYCSGGEGNEVCEPDYPNDDEFFVTDIWGVRGHQQSVDYDEVDDVADLLIGEIPYSCLWAARGVIVSQKDLDAGTFNSLNVEDDPITPDVDETKTVELGDIIWFKPERLTSGRRDAYIPVVGFARGAGFAIAWQEDPEGLRPGKGKGPGQGWSGAISNHKTDIWYSYLNYHDFSVVDENFIPGGDPDPDRPGLGRPKALMPFSLPVRISDNDMINTDTLKVIQGADCVTPPNATEPVCFPEVSDGTFTPLDPETVANYFCDGPSPIENCCDHDNHHDDPNCEGLEGLHGNLTGTKRYAYMARSIDDDGNGVPDFGYFEDRGGTLDLCDISGANSYMDSLPGTSAHERWFGFANNAGASKLVCVSSDGRVMDGDVSASRPNIQLKPYTKSDGTKSAWVLLAYEESKGMGHSLDASDHDNDDELVGDQPEEPGQDKPIKQDLGKNVIYHTFDFAQPDLVAPGHIVNLPALCGGLYPNYCGDDYDGTNPTCTCEAGEPVPLYFDYYVDNGDGTGEWVPDETKFLQYRTEIARRTRFIVQSPGKMGATKTLGAIIYKQGQEGQGRPADVFIRRIVKSGTGNPFAFKNFECSNYLDNGSFDLPGCPTDGIKGYNCNAWGEAYSDKLCGGIFTDPNGGYTRRDHINLTSAMIDLSVDAGPDDDTPDDPTDDLYGTDKVLLWSQYPENLGDESFGGTFEFGVSGMYSNARSHRGFIRGDFLVTAFAFSPNWAAGRNGRDRYNFYIRKSFDGGQTWTTTPSDLGGTGINYCREWRSDPTVPDEDGSGNAPPVFDGFDPECVAWCPPCEDECICEVTGEEIQAGAFEPMIKVSQFDNNKETSADPRLGATPPTFPLDGRDPALPVLRFVEDEYVDNVLFVAWGGGDNLKSTGGMTVTPEAPPTDIWYTRSEDYGDTFLKIPWVIGGVNSNQGYGETVWRYDFLAKGDEEEQGECQLRATPDGSKMYGIYHQMVPEATDPEEPITRWYPWEPEVSHDNDIWFRRVIFWPDAVTTP